jgi:2-dehydro-3-deoxyphosphogluconate aldolase/(4S)-4-hydroxy-2-oxoglutarate aldolase
LIPSVAKIADQNNLLWIPGCMTPSEIIHAESLGAKMIKLFPGNILGPGFMSAIKELFPSMMFMPTGGVELDKDNITTWFKAGVSAVGMGSKLITKELLETKNYAQITATTKEVITIIKSIKS